MLLRGVIETKIQKIFDFWGIISTFVEVTGEKLVGGLPLSSNRVKRAC